MIALRRTILMADDDAEDCLLVATPARIRLALRPALRPRRRGAVRLPAATGEFAGSQAGPRPDLILMDLKMPPRTAANCSRQLKADPHYRQIPVVALTTSTASDDVAYCYDAGVNAYITKPATFRALVEVCAARQVLAGSRGVAAETAGLRIGVPMAERRIRILLVEDDPDDVWVMRQPAERPLGRAVRDGERGNALGGHRALAPTTCST